MGLLAKTAWAFQVLITAAMTLVAGIPRFDCRCSQGQVKPFSLILASSGSQCCCGRCGSSTGGASGRCCSRGSQDQKQAKTPSCCGQSRHRPGRQARPETSQYTQNACCVMTLAQSENATPAKTVRAVNKDLTPGDFLTCQTALVSTWQTIGSGQSLGPLHSLAPPGDLVTLLQHLLI